MHVSDQDREHLRLLEIFHYVYAGVTALLSLIPLIHVSMGLAIVFGAFPGSGSSAGPPPPAFMGWFFVVIGGIIILVGEAFAILNFFVGRMIRERRGRMFCMIVAAFNCLNMPFGTALGVFSLVVLSRLPVKAVFEAPAHDRP